MQKNLDQQSPFQKSEILQQLCSKQLQQAQYQQNLQSQKFFGHWNKQQNIKYLVFIRSNQKLFEKNQQRKVWKIYKVMSLYIDTRNVYQCRNHHKKMIQKYHCLENLIEELDHLYSAKSIKKAAKNYQERYGNIIQQFTPKRIRRNKKVNPVNEDKTNNQQILQTSKTIESKTLPPTLQNQIPSPQLPIQADINYIQPNQIYNYLQAIVCVQQWQYLCAYSQYLGY